MEAGRWILLVEDSEDEAQLALRALGRSGAAHEPCIARDGDEAIGLLSDSPGAPAAAFLDVKLPGMSGLDVLAWIRSSETHRRVPVVVFVAGTDEELFRRALELGANSLIRKELDYDAYMERVGLAFRYWLTVNVSIPR